MIPMRQPPRYTLQLKNGLPSAEFQWTLYATEPMELDLVIVVWPSGSRLVPMQTTVLNNGDELTWTYTVTGEVTR